jgi:hypothetical protein
MNLLKGSVKVNGLLAKFVTKSLLSKKMKAFLNLAYILDIHFTWFWPMVEVVIDINNQTVWAFL